MSAETFGAGLLAEVKHQSLTSLLDDVRLILEPQPKARLGPSSLNQLVDLVRQSQPVAAHTQNEAPSTSLAEPSSELSFDDIDLLTHNRTIRHKVPPKLKPVIINLQSSTPSSTVASRALLYQLAARALLPRSYGGNQTAVVWLDASNKFSATKLYQAVVSFMRQPQASDVPTDTDSAHKFTNEAREALRHVHIITSSSSAQLLRSLEQLPAYLSDSTRHHSSSRVLDLIVLDSATHFYWQDRFSAELTRLNALPTSPDQAAVTSANIPQPQPVSARIATQLNGLAAHYDCAVIYATDSLDFRSPSNFTSLSSDVWTSTALLTLTAKRANVTHFAPQMGAEECLRDRQKRQEAVEAGKVKFTAVAMGKNIGGFEASITENGLRF